MPAARWCAEEEPGAPLGRRLGLRHMGDGSFLAVRLHGHPGSDDEARAGVDAHEAAHAPGSQRRSARDVVDALDFAGVQQDNFSVSAGTGRGPGRLGGP